MGRDPRHSRNHRNGVSQVFLWGGHRMKITQPTINPTNKLTAAVAGAFAWALWKAIMVAFVPEFGGEYLYDAAVPVFVGVAGWFIRDEANTTAVVVQTPAPTETEPA